MARKHAHQNKKHSDASKNNAISTKSTVWIVSLVAFILIGMGIGVYMYNDMLKETKQPIVTPSQKIETVVQPKAVVAEPKSTLQNVELNTTWRIVTGKQIGRAHV